MLREHAEGRNIGAILKISSGYHCSDHAEGVRRVFAMVFNDDIYDVLASANALGKKLDAAYDKREILEELRCYPRVRYVFYCLAKIRYVHRMEDLQNSTAPILEEYGVRSVFLAGACAKREVNNDSSADILDNDSRVDIFVVSEDTRIQDADSMLTLTLALERQLSKEVSLRDLNTYKEQLRKGHPEQWDRILHELVPLLGS